MAERKAASLSPDDMVSGGLPDDFDGTITNVAFVSWDYNETIDTPVLALRVDIEPDEDSDEENFSQHYSAGDMKYFVPSDDGKEALPVGKRDALSNSSNAAQFITALLNAEGFAELGREIGTSVDAFEGIRCHFDRVDQPKRSGIVNAEGERRKQILVVTEVHEEAGAKPTKKKAAKKAPAKKGKAAPAAADDAEVDSELDEAIAEALITALAEKEAPIKRRATSGVILKALKSDPRKSAAVKRVFQIEFLENEENGWAWDADAQEISLG